MVSADMPCATERSRDVRRHHDHAVPRLDGDAVQPQAGEPVAVGIPCFAEDDLGTRRKMARERVGITPIQGAAAAGRLL